MRKTPGAVGRDMAKHLLLIENPQAGKRKGSRGLLGAAQVFADAGYEVDIRQTGRRGDAGRFAAMYGAMSDLVVCVGGDGTFNETVGGLVRAGLSTPVGYIPAGSSNDFAASLNLPRDPVTAARKMVQGSPRKMDLVRFDGELFSNAAEFGAFTWLGYTTPQIMKNAIGPTAYVLNGIRDLPKIRPETLRVAAGGKTYAGDYIFGTICNTTRMGAVALPAGMEAPDDGMVEVLLVRQPVMLYQWQETVAGILNHEYPPEYVDFFRADKLTIESDEPVTWCLDGEKKEAPHQTQVEVEPGLLTLMMGR